MKKAIFTVRFFRGKGGLYFFGEGIPQKFHISSEDGDVQSFEASQTPGRRQIVAVPGVAPVGGSIEVQVADEGGNILSPFSNNKYPDGPFMGAIYYDL